jgi:hypothetical protein
VLPDPDQPPLQADPGPSWRHAIKIYRVSVFR